MVYEIYNKENTYLTKHNDIYYPEKFVQDYPAVNIEKMLVGLTGRVVQSVEPLSYVRGMYKIKGDVSDEDALCLIREKKSIEETENTPLERIAAALEFLELLNM